MAGPMGLPTILSNRGSPVGRVTFADQLESPNQFQDILVQSMFANIIALPPKQDSVFISKPAKLPSLSHRNDDSDEDLPKQPLTRGEFRKNSNAHGRERRYGNQRSLTRARFGGDDLVASAVH